MERKAEQVIQKENDNKVKREPLVSVNTELEIRVNSSIEREPIDTNGPRGRAIRGPFGVY